MGRKTITKVHLHLSHFQHLQDSNGPHRSSLHSDNYWCGSHPHKEFLGGNWGFEKGKNLTRQKCQRHHGAIL